MKFYTSILDHMKANVIKIQQRGPLKRLMTSRKDQKYIADFQVELNALVSLYHIFTSVCHLIHLIIQPNFQACLRVEEISQEASKSSYNN